MSNLAQFRSETGIELVINTDTGEAFATQAGYSRMSGKSVSTISARMLSLRDDSVKSAEIQTGKGIRSVQLLPAKIVYRWLMKDKPELAVEMGEVGATVYLHQMAGYKVTSDALVAQQSAPQMLPEERLQIGMSALQFFGIDQTNPRLTQGLQDWCLNLMLNQKQLMPAEDLWVGVAERAEELGYGRIGADLSLRTRLGQAVAKLQLNRKKEKRLCNGTQREIWIYRVCDELDNGIRLFFQVENAIAPQ